MVLHYKDKDWFSFILDSTSGLVKNYFEGKVIGVLKKQKFFLVQKKDEGPIYCYDRNGKFQYKGDVFWIISR